MTPSYTMPLPGVRIGNAEDRHVCTGTTVCLFDEPATAAVHIMGGAPGTRETELLAAENTVSEVDAIVLSGGSAFGLDAAGGAQAWLREMGRGIQLDPVRIPIVPCAILFDLRNGGDKEWGRYSPYRELGYAATASAEASFELGQAGAAFGANTATTPGGLGAAATTVAGGTVFAIAAVNAAGSPLIGNTSHFWAAPFERDAEFGGLGYPVPWPDDAHIPRTKAGQRVAGANTTLAIVVTDLRLDSGDCQRLAVSSHDGFTRALYPVHTSADGDLIFAASTGRKTVEREDLMDLLISAGNVVARAISVGVYHAMRAGDAG